MTTVNFKLRLIDRAFTLAKNILLLVDNFPNKRSAVIIADQMIRSGTSIGANIVEAQAGSTKKDFINFLNHALKSANETVFWLKLANEIDKNQTEKIFILKGETEELAKILGASISTLKAKEKLHI